MNCPGPCRSRRGGPRTIAPKTSTPSVELAPAPYFLDMTASTRRYPEKDSQFRADEISGARWDHDADFIPSAA